MIPTLGRSLSSLFHSNGVHQPNGANGWHGLIRPSPVRFFVRWLKPPTPVKHKVVINTQPQPWQRHAAKLAKRERLGWNERRVAREFRKIEAASALRNAMNLVVGMGA